MNKKRLPVVLGCLGVLGVIVVLVVYGYLYMTSVSASQSVVFIRAPQNGDKLETGQPIQVRALARDDNKITRIELWVDGQLLDAQDSSTQSGINPFPLLATWYPQVGTHTLIARAFDSRGGATQATINVEALTSPDRDVDGVADEADTCPDQQGNPAADGCPDRDFDGIADASDACPNEAGLPESGCPAPSERDRDGDGMLNETDACPDEAGSPLADGCIDYDGDGTGDATDACPAEPGSGADGCPEADGSLPPDPVPGGESSPPLPLPGEEPPVPGLGEGPIAPSFLGEIFVTPIEKAPVRLNIEAYYLALGTRFDRLRCYVRFDDSEPTPYEFEQFSDLHWDIGAELAGENSVTISHEETDPLEIYIECEGYIGEGRPVFLADMNAAHLREEWDGRDLSIETADAIVHYRVLELTCDEPICPAPVLNSVGLGPRGEGPYTLSWNWHGDHTAISGYRLVVSTGAESSSVNIPDPAMNSVDVADYMPACGETVSFQVYAYREEGNLRSGLSNAQEWRGEPCTYNAHVIFTTIDVHNPPSDENSLHHPGPIYGEFWISNGSTTESLPFNACWCYFGPGMTFWGWCEGLKLQEGVYSINRGIFDWIDTAQASCIGDGCNSNDFYAPFSSAVNIPLENGSDLTIGGLIMDCDAKNSNDVLYREQESVTIDVNELEYFTEPIESTLNGDHVNLNYFIRMAR